MPLLMLLMPPLLPPPLLPLPLLTGQPKISNFGDFPFPFPVPEGQREGANEVDGATEGPADGMTEGLDEVDGATEGPADGITEGVSEGPSDGEREGASDGEREGTSDGLTEGMREGTSDGLTDGTREGPADGGKDGMSDGPADGATEGPWDVEGATEGPADGVTEGEADTVGAEVQKKLCKRKHSKSEGGRKLQSIANLDTTKTYRRAIHAFTHGKGRPNRSTDCSTALSFCTHTPLTAHATLQLSSRGKAGNPDDGELGFNGKGLCGRAFIGRKAVRHKTDNNTDGSNVGEASKKIAGVEVHAGEEEIESMRSPSFFTSSLVEWIRMTETRIREARKRGLLGRLVVHKCMCDYYPVSCH